MPNPYHLSVIPSLKILYCITPKVASRLWRNALYEFNKDLLIPLPLYLVITRRFPWNGSTSLVGYLEPTLKCLITTFLELLWVFLSRMNKRKEPIPGCSRQCAAQCLFQLALWIKHFLWRWYCGKKQIEMWIIVVCTLIDNEYVSLLFSQTFFFYSYCFCMLSKFALKGLKGKSHAFKSRICVMLFQIRVGVFSIVNKSSQRFRLSLSLILW